MINVNLSARVARLGLSAMLLAPLLFFMATTVAQEPDRSAASQPSESPESAESPESPVYEIRYRSTFEPEQTARNPFWPIGWTPPKKADPNATPAPQIVQVPPGLFRLTSILTGSPAIAMIDGKDYMVGDTIEKNVQNTRVQLKVLAIRDGFVVLGYPGGTVTIRN